MRRLFNWLKSWDYRIKFLMVGCLNTAVGLGSYWLVLLLFGVNLTQKEIAVLPIVIATIISQVLGLINSYCWNKFFTFESKVKSKIETIKFVALYLFVFIIEYVLKLGLNKVPNFNQIIIAIITIIMTTTLSFIGQRYFVFRKQKINDGGTTNLNQNEGEKTE